MAKPRRTKKALIQFAIAAVVAIVVGVVGIGLVLLLIGGMNQANQMQAEQQQRQMEDLEQKLSATQEKLEKANENNTAKRKYYEVRAVKPITSGVPIEADMLEAVEMPEGQRPEPNSYFKTSAVVGKISAVDLHVGETITKKKLIEMNDNIDISEGKRAVSIAVTNVGAVGGELFNGARVDIMATFKEEQLTKTLLQNITLIRSM